MARRNRRKGPVASLTYRGLTAPVGNVEYVYEPILTGPRRHTVGELGFTCIPLHPFSPEAFAKDLETFGPGVGVIADSSIYLHELDRQVWDALLRNNQLRMVEPVAVEIEPWLRDPRGVNTAIHSIVKDSAELRSNAVPIVQIPESRNDLTFAAEWYINLLGLRKKVRSAFRDVKLTETGVKPGNAALNDIIRKSYGERSQRLAISGDKAKVAAHRYHDEAIVMLAIFHALATGRDTILLTRDEDILEQFRKLCWLIDTHYRDMRLATVYAGDPFAFRPILRARDADPVVRRALAKAFMDDDVIMLGKPSGRLRELLPPKREVVSVHCCRIRDLTEIVTFGLIDDFRSLIRMKADTEGRNTNRFDGKNCHVSLGPLMRKVGNWAVIGRDREVPRGRFRYSMIDVNLVLNEREGTTRVMPTNIMLP